MSIMKLNNLSEAQEYSLKTDQRGSNIGSGISPRQSEGLNSGQNMGQRATEYMQPVRAKAVNNTSSSTAASVSTAAKILDYLPSIVTRDKLLRDLLSLEAKYGMTSKEFYELWKQGAAPRILDTIKWISLWEVWRERYLL